MSIFDKEFRICHDMHSALCPSPSAFDYPTGPKSAGFLDDFSLVVLRLGSQHCQPARVCFLRRFSCQNRNVSSRGTFKRFQVSDVGRESDTHQHGIPLDGIKCRGARALLDCGSLGTEDSRIHHAWQHSSADADDLSCGAAGSGVARAGARSTCVPPSGARQVRHQRLPGRQARGRPRGPFESLHPSPWRAPSDRPGDPTLSPEKLVLRCAVTLAAAS